jgi:hypothetical protein
VELTKLFDIMRETDITLDSCVCSDQFANNTINEKERAATDLLAVAGAGAGAGAGASASASASAGAGRKESYAVTSL